MIFLILVFSTNFYPILSDLVTLFDRKLQFFKKNLAKMTINGIFNVARFARNVSK